MLARNPAIKSRQVGRPRHLWDHKVAAFCRYKWTTRGTRKHGWHPPTRSTTLHGLNEMICKHKFVNIFFLVHRLRLERARHTASIIAHKKIIVQTYLRRCTTLGANGRKGKPLERPLSISRHFERIDGFAAQPAAFKSYFIYNDIHAECLVLDWG